MRKPAAAPLALLLSAVLISPSSWSGDKPFAVIAGSGLAEHHLSRDSVSLIYKRKQNYWENGIRIQPANLPPTNPLRRTFSQAILGHPPEGMEEYWREMYFHGVLPPHVLASEEAVLLFVASTPGAIGYVSACPSDRKVNVVFSVGDVPGCSK
jgi:hypothetical protein